MATQNQTDASTALVPMPRRAEIEDFLSLACGEAIQLVVIPQDGSPLVAKWFGDDASRAAAWAKKQNASRHNIYWSVNVVREGLNGKAKKTDIVGVRYAHVDIDPPKDGSAWDKDYKTLDLELLDTPPSFIIDSGGGLQAFWALERNADTTEIERINTAIAVRLGGDNCHNIDRVMRVPGTVNWPNAKKREAGRTSALASLKGRTGKTYTVAQLAEAFPLPAGDSQERKNDAKALDQPAADEGALWTPDGLDRADRLTRLGIDTDSMLYRLITNPDGTDRSNDVFAAACEMVRLGHGDNAIMGVLLDSELLISAHCLDQPNHERAARRAIANARKNVASSPDFTVLPSGPITATPFAFLDPVSIPRRRWLYGHHLLRGSLAVIVAPGGTGKTALTVGMALSLASGRPLLGKDVPEGSQRVWLWNLEDARDELNRSIAAACQHHDIKPDDLADRLFVDSGLDDKGLCTAVQDRQGFTIRQPVYDALVAEITARDIDVLIVDPFVSSHNVAENDNGAIDAVAKAWAKIAAQSGCAVILVHHTSKLAGSEVTAERARGASALVNAARSVVALNRMSAAEAKTLRVDEADRRRSFRAYDDKNNRAPPAEGSDWYQLESAILPNGEDEDCFGDSVGVVVPWTPPAASADKLEPEQVAALQKLIGQGEWRADQRADAWAGKAVAEVFGFDLDDPFGKSRTKDILKECQKAGWLRTERRKDSGRQNRTWIIVGEPIALPTDVPPESRMGSSAPVLQSAPVASGANHRTVLRSSLSPLGETGVERSSDTGTGAQPPEPHDD